MSKSVPVVKLTNPDRVVRFDFECFARIEEALDTTVSALIDQFRTFNALPASELAKPEKERRAPTAEEQAAAAKRVSIGMVAKFVAACFGVDLELLSEIVPANRLIGVFGELSVGFGQAIEAFGSEDSPHPSATQAASDGAVPGHELNAAFVHEN